ncbi:hypothetical protein [Herbiconiux sp. UC225_62]
MIVPSVTTILIPPAPRRLNERDTADSLADMVAESTARTQQ